MVSDQANVAARRYSLSNARRGIVLSGLTHMLNFTELVGEPYRARRRLAGNLPCDANREGLSLFRRGSIEDVMAELRHLDELYPRKYRLPPWIEAAPLYAKHIRTYLILWDVVDYPVIKGWHPYPCDNVQEEDLTLLVDQGYIVRSHVEPDWTSGHEEVVE